MRIDLTTACQLAPYAALALLSIFGLIGTPIMIVMLVVLMSTSRRGACWPARKA